MPKVSYKDALTNGLRQDSRAILNDSFMVEYFGLEPTQWGARTPEPYESLLDHGLTLSWPFPQLFRGRTETLLCTDRTIYRVDESTWSLVPVILYDFLDPSSVVELSPGGASWHFLDRGNVWFLFNGQAVVWRSPWKDANKVFAQEATTIATGCYHGGRIFCGGFDASNYWSEEWEDYWGTLAPGHTMIPPHSNSISWGPIGVIDLPLLFDANLARANEEVYMDILRRSQHGIRDIDWIGSVWNMKPLGDHVIVYGSDGIGALSGFITNDIPQVGLVSDFHHLGLLSRSSVGGDLREHLFVNSVGEVYKITSDLTLKYLGYKEIFENSISTELLVVFDPRLREYYLSNGDTSYKVTGTGLCHIDPPVTSAYRIDKGDGAKLRGIVFPSTTPSTVRLTTVPTDFSTRSVKLIESVTIDSSQTGFSLIVKSRFDTSRPFEEVFRGDFDECGQAFVNVSGVEFMFTIFTHGPLNSSITNLVIDVSESSKIAVPEALYV